MMGSKIIQDGFPVRIPEDSLQTTFEWKKPKLVFVNSISDLFHPEVPLDFIRKVFDVMNETPLHTYQVFTKRADMIFELHTNLTRQK